MSNFSPCFFLSLHHTISHLLTQGPLFPLPDPPDQARQLCHCSKRGEHGLRPAGGQTEQGHLSHRRGHECRPAAAQVSVHLRRSARISLLDLSIPECWVWVKYISPALFRAKPNLCGIDLWSMFNI